MKLINFAKSYLLYIVLVAALISMMGSLFFSEILKLPLCSLCWYQRIAMFPLVAILTVGTLRQDKGLHLYVLPLSIFGMLVAFYHTLIQYGLINEAITPCSLGISCSTKYLNLFGFITIPLLSLLSFSLITFGMLAYRKVNQ
jgi:disulfide bond formation protein DsbB